MDAEFTLQKNKLVCDPELLHKLTKPQVVIQMPQEGRESGDGGFLWGYFFGVLTFLGMTFLNIWLSRDNDEPIPPVAPAPESRRYTSRDRRRESEPPRRTNSPAETTFFELASRSKQQQDTGVDGPRE